MKNHQDKLVALLRRMSEALWNVFDYIGPDVEDTGNDAPYKALAWEAEDLARNAEDVIEQLVEETRRKSRGKRRMKR